MCDTLHFLILAKGDMLSDLQFRIKQVNFPYKPICCTDNLTHAMSLIASNPPDLIFIEISAFDIDPIQLIEMIRSRAISANIVLLSDAFDYSLIRNAVELGCKDFLRIPIETDKLSDTLSRTLRAKCGIVGVVYQELMENYPQTININEIAKKLNISCNHLIREFKKRYGLTPLQCLTKKRLDESMKLLTGTTLSITNIAEAVGYTDVKYFILMFKKHFGISPAQYRSNSSSVPKKQLVSGNSIKD